MTFLQWQRRSFSQDLFAQSCMIREMYRAGIEAMSPVLLLLLTLTVAGPQSSTGSLRVQFITSANQPLQKTAVRIRFETSGPRRYPLEIQTTTDSSGFIFVPELPVLPVKIHLEAAGFDDYSADVNIKAGEITTVT